MARPEKPWEPEWVKHRDSLSEGGQGRTYLARRRSDPPDSWQYVLKVIRDEKRADSRPRIAAEGAALKLLEHHPGIAKLVASNTDQYTESVPLYLITERVVGPGVDRLRAGRAPSLREAAHLTIRVLETLHDCHALGVLHRDIKPNNIILRDGQIDSPILIDFGLAYGTDLLPGESITVTEQPVGNRTVVLPEQWGDSAAKKDPVSDVTQVVALFFYLLFNRDVGNLAHTQHIKPHDRFDWRSGLPENVASWQVDQIGRIFDTGFELDSLRRWSSAERLKAELEVLLLDAAPPPRLKPVDERVRQLRSRANNATNQLLMRAQELGAEVHQAVLQTTDRIHNEFSQYISLVRAGGGQWEAANRQFSFVLNLQARLRGTPAQVISYSLRLFDTDVFVYEEISGYRIVGVSPFARPANPPAAPPPGALLQVPVFDPRAKEDIQTVIENRVHELVEAALSHAPAPEGR